ncbi:hypothetical protein B0H21DRAFT_186606 [Amylocystis lapponica]|nr:hypothetical protein B0H21DRAFT_186606 [Amylocystis lapponica]
MSWGWWTLDPSRSCRRTRRAPGPLSVSHCRHPSPAFPLDLHMAAAPLLSRSASLSQIWPFSYPQPSMQMLPRSPTTDLSLAAARELMQSFRSAADEITLVQSCCGPYFGLRRRISCARESQVCMHASKHCSFTAAGRYLDPADNTFDLYWENSDEASVILAYFCRRCLQAPPYSRRSAALCLWVIVGAGGESPTKYKTRQSATERLSSVHIGASFCGLVDVVFWRLGSRCLLSQERP